MNVFVKFRDMKMMSFWVSRRVTVTELKRRIMKRLDGDLFIVRGDSRLLTLWNPLVGRRIISGGARDNEIHEGSLIEARFPTEEEMKARTIITKGKTTIQINQIPTRILREIIGQLSLQESAIARELIRRECQEKEP